MEDKSFEMVLAIFIGIIMMFIMSGFIVSIVIIHRQRQIKNRHKVQMLKTDYENIILNTEKEIREETLKYVSQELHDNIGQMLSLAKLVLNSPEPTAAAEGKRLINQIIKEVRILSKSINKDYLKDVRFQEFLEEELHKIEKSGFCKTSLTIQNGLEDPQDSNKKLVLIRVVQECLNNAIKHASPNIIAISLEQDESYMILTIKDDGIGFDTSVKTTGLGLRNLESRLQAIEGGLEMSSELQKGTEIKIKVNV
ncbi:sensor histidine kinase [Negadavirga shengliensis]|uniref:histidine kinase n=1 Tax=Negadavirga shengliensis TaxID=1389218 RepID=A0ABV9SWF5_9BACT